MEVILILLAKAVKVVAVVVSYVSSTASIFWANHEPKMPESMIDKHL